MVVALEHLPQRWHILQRVLIVAAATVLAACAAQPGQWSSVDGKAGTPTPRHESAWVAHQGKLYLIGGRRSNPTDVFDPVTERWSQRSAPPIEVHHMQAVSFGDAIYLLGAMTGPWPNEQPLDRVLKYYPDKDHYEWGHTIPEARRRGGAGVVVHNDKIYLVGGITDGHMSGSRPWLDEYDPVSGDWRILPDAPNARDHVQAATIDNRMFVFAGRRTSRETGEDITLTVGHGNVFDFASEQWLSVTEALRVPTERAGNMIMVWGDEVIVAGGESGEQRSAHADVEAYNVVTESWRRLPSLKRGRHGTAIAVVDDIAYTAAGSGNRGGEPELIDIERLTLTPTTSASISTIETAEVHQRWHTVTLTFESPYTSETAVNNPFTDSRLQVTLTNADQRYTVRGFYAADGNAANTGASTGSIWQARFTPPAVGTWTYEATLRAGTDIAISNGADAGVSLPLAHDRGTFVVTESDKTGGDFRHLGQLSVQNGYFHTAGNSARWIKGGTNSPENFLAYTDFDSTYRLTRQARDGEAAATGDIHTFASHLSDWRTNDPVWRAGSGKSIIGAINYLADAGMNSAYFLTLNITGDGNDVWPYLSPHDFERFDASKLDQWERVFSHMQRRGIMLHVVLQETENERLLDGGDTARLRKLYLNELVARFAHHPGLVWNLGEENGPAPWSPDAQTTPQRMAMASYIKAIDPYRHPVLLHTHASAHEKEAILAPLLGFADIDGLSFQVDDPLRVNAELMLWRERSAAAGNPWLITMDEIGPWHTGAVPDADSSDGHAGLRRHALWGSLLAGGAGVEWYFGAKFPANDLTSEDWRRRESLWQQTKVAVDFFDELAIESFAPCNALVSGYCLGSIGDTYIIYADADSDSIQLDLGDVSKRFSVSWLDPLTGATSPRGTHTTVVGPGVVTLVPPSTDVDWVAWVAVDKEQPLL